MIREGLERATGFVAQHNRITLLVMVLLSAAVIAGVPQLDTGSQAGASADAFDHLDRVQAAEYVNDNYGNDSANENRSIRTVYVYDADGNVLSKESLVAGLRYQQEIRDNESVAAALHDDGTVGLANLVATRAADGENPDLAAQIAALEAASPGEVEQLVATTLSEDPRALRYLPSAHDPGSTTATDRRILVAFDTSASDETISAASAALHDEAEARADAGFMTTGGQALAEYQSHFFGQMVELVLPVALGFILFVLAFSYRDLVDIVVGMTGVVLAVAWMFGIMGWIGVAAGTISIIPVVLITGLSIDFGFHVFNRYREERGPDDGIRAAMGRGTFLVATALVLVTVTAAIGFLSNLVNPLGQIRNLGISITLGVVSAFIIFLTVVPALKISIDGTLERFGLDRRKAALGRGKYLGPVLGRSATLARRAAPAVVLVAVVVGAAGGVAWTQLDQEQFDNSPGEVPEWKENLPGFLGWEQSEYIERATHVGEVYQPASEDAAQQSVILIEGDVTGDETLANIHAGIERIRDRDGGLLLDQPGVQPVQSPVTAMRAVARQDQDFAAAFEAADSNGDGVPDRNLASLYDAFYEADSDVASRVIERTDGGEYRSVLVRLAITSDWTERKETVATLVDGAGVMEQGADRSATVAGQSAIVQSLLNDLIDGVLQTMVIALSAIVVVLALAFRVMHGSATFGAVVAIPIAVVVGMVVGGMYLLEIPLNLLTALLMSMVLGLGVDYNIHLGDRFADERREGKSTDEALEAAVTGTGGALLGSTLTSVGAFSALLLVPLASLRGFATIVVVALSTAFLVSVVVLPSVLVLWARHGPDVTTTETNTRDVTPQD